MEKKFAKYRESTIIHETKWRDAKTTQDRYEEKIKELTKSRDEIRNERDIAIQKLALQQKTMVFVNVNQKKRSDTNKDINEIQRLKVELQKSRSQLSTQMCIPPKDNNRIKKLRKTIEILQRDKINLMKKINDQVLETKKQTTLIKHEVYMSKKKDKRLFRSKNVLNSN